VAFSYAEEIFRQGAELSALFESGHHPARETLKVGAVATLSRNFQEGFLAPLLERDDLELSLQSGGLDDLLRRLSAHRLDLVLSNQPVQGDQQNPFRSRRIARQPVSIIGPPDAATNVVFPDFLQGLRLIVPGAENNIRHAFDQFCDYHKVRPRLIAEVDDMAMMRLLARDTRYFSVLPPVVVRDELKAGSLVDYGALPGVFEEFYAISIRRRFEPASLARLLAQPVGDFLNQV
jgi:LysR family transcriptional activator of nhaA